MVAAAGVGATVSVAASAVVAAAGVGATVSVAIAVVVVGAAATGGGATGRAVAVAVAVAASVLSVKLFFDVSSFVSRVLLNSINMIPLVRSDFLFVCPPPPPFRRRTTPSGPSLWPSTYPTSSGRPLRHTSISLSSSGKKTAYSKNNFEKSYN